MQASERNRYVEVEVLRNLLPCSAIDTYRAGRGLFDLSDGIDGTGVRLIEQGISRQHQS